MISIPAWSPWYDPDVQEENLAETLEILAQVLPNMMKTANLWL